MGLAKDRFIFILNYINDSFVFFLKVADRICHQLELGLLFFNNILHLILLSLLLPSELITQGTQLFLHIILNSFTQDINLGTQGLVTFLKLLHILINFCLNCLDFCCNYHIHFRFSHIISITDDSLSVFDVFDFSSQGSNRVSLGLVGGFLFVVGLNEVIYHVSQVLVHPFLSLVEAFLLLQGFRNFLLLRLKIL